MTLSGVPMISRAGREKKSPTNAMIMPLIRAKRMDVCTVSDISWDFPAAKKRAASTLLPRETPMNMFTNILISAVVEPTAARASLPVNLPTTIISTALNINCKILESIRGREKEISFFMMGPLHISISYLLFFTISPHKFIHFTCYNHIAVHSRIIS